MNLDSYENMLAAVQAFHAKHRFKEQGGEDMTYRVALMAEELGEIAECVLRDHRASRERRWRKRSRTCLSSCSAPPLPPSSTSSRRSGTS